MTLLFLETKSMFGTSTDKNTDNNKKINYRVPTDSTYRIKHLVQSVTNYNTFKIYAN